MGRLLVVVLALILISCAGEKKTSGAVGDTTIVVLDSVKNTLIKDTIITLDTVIVTSKK